uniref:Uncharacterized protein n=1 Tax=Avena sativa TaxID=4498 RepID=A0ACD5YT23_AVESA
MACLCISAVLLCGLCVSLAVVASESGPESKKSAFGAIGLESTQVFKLPRAVILGSVACLPYTLLTVAGFLVMMMSSPVEGSVSQGEIIGSVIVDVGRFGIHAISSLVIFAFMESDQLDRTLVENGPLVPVLEGL